ncbi:MAG TPA: DctP family TRAP transporter solute-binding subunit [Spirochaetia bacterium]|nr:DctP family TRAP transporter solute-binding subunit [Spirochaetia bacterium]
MNRFHRFRTAAVISIAALFIVVGAGSVFAGGNQEKTSNGQGNAQQSNTPAAGTSTPAQSSGGTAPAVTPASGKPDYTLKFATVAGPKDQQTLAMNLFAKVVNEISGGRIVVQVFPSGQLADQKTEILDVQNGSLDMGSDASPSWFSSLADYPQIGVLESAYLYSSLDEMYRVLLGPVGQQYWNTLEQKSGIKVLDVWYLGTRELDLTKKAGPVKTPADLKGIKLRMPNSDAWLDAGRSLGANPTPLGFGEVYLALKTGTIDGQDNPIPTDATEKFFEVTHYLILTNHMIGYITPIINAKLWNSMPKEDQLYIEKALQIARYYNNYETLLNEDRLLAEAQKQYGIEVVIPDQKAFMEHARQFYSQPKFDKMWGPGVYAKLQALGE